LFSPAGQKEREAAIGVSALLVNLLGVEWALEKEGESKTFVLLLIHLVCVEVRMTLEDLNPAQVGGAVVECDVEVGHTGYNI